MDDLNDFYRDIQTFLMKKDSECGKLRYLSSRTTDDNCDNIDDVCETIGSVFDSNEIPKEEQVSVIDSKCVNAFKYLILNTNFQCQDYLTEDFINGHLVDMCPPLSSYLMIEIIWALEYEEILADSILYFPLDLVNEMLEIIRRCIILLDFKRAYSFINRLIFNACKKIIITCDFGAQSTDFSQSFETFSMNIHELIKLLKWENFQKFGKVVKIKKSERYGIALKDLLDLIVNCFETAKGVTVDPEIKKLYQVTFGKEIDFTKVDEEMAKESLGNLNSQLLLILFESLNEINMDHYLDWASLEYNGDPDISLQQMIGLGCFKLDELLRKNEVDDQKHLLPCLQHFLVKPESINSSKNMDLQKLYDGIETGNKKCMKELLKRHESWNHSTFKLIKANLSLLDKDDFTIILEYMTILMMKPGQEEHKQLVFSTITNSLFLQSLSNLYEITLNYILRHDGANNLESEKTEDTFKNFILLNNNLKSSNNLRTVLFYLMKNPCKILKILLKICIGCPEFNTVMISPNHLGLLSPIMTIRDGKNGKLILSALKNLGIENTQWEPKKFMLFIESMIDQNIFTADELINNVYIHWLETENLSVSSIKSTLNNLRNITSSCTTMVKFESLLKAIAQRMLYYRKNDNPKATKYTSDELLTMMIRIIEALTGEREDQREWFNSKEIRESLIFIENSFQPIDKHYLMRNCTLKGYFDITDVIEDYKRRIQKVLFQISEDDNVAQSIDCLNLEEEILMHMITSCTEAEYTRLGFEYSVIHWDYFKKLDEHEAYNNYISMTIKSCLFCLEQSDPRTDSFCFMIKCLACFSKAISMLDSNLDDKKLLEILRYNFGKLNESIKDTDYVIVYQETLQLVNNCNDDQSSFKCLQDVTKFIHDFGCRCLEIILVKKNEISGDNKKHLMAQALIADCLNTNTPVTQPSVIVRLHHQLLCQTV